MTSLHLRVYGKYAPILCPGTTGSAEWISACICGPGTRPDLDVVLLGSLCKREGLRCIPLLVACLCPDRLQCAESGSRDAGPERTGPAFGDRAHGQCARPTAAGCCSGGLCHPFHNVWG